MAEGYNLFKEDLAKNLNGLSRYQNASSKGPGGLAVNMGIAPESLFSAAPQMAPTPQI